MHKVQVNAQAIERIKDNGQLGRALLKSSSGWPGIRFVAKPCEFVGEEALCGKLGEAFFSFRRPYARRARLLPGAVPSLQPKVAGTLFHTSLNISSIMILNKS